MCCMYDGGICQEGVVVSRVWQGEGLASDSELFCFFTIDNEGRVSSSYFLIRSYELGLIRLVYRSPCALYGGCIPFFG